MIKFWSQDTLICERVLGKLTPTPPGVEFWRTKVRFYCARHRKNEKRTRFGFAGPSLCGVKMKILKKVRILAGLFDKMELGEIKGTNNNYY